MLRFYFPDVPTPLTREELPHDSPPPLIVGTELTEEEVLFLKHTFKLHHLAIEDALHKKQRTKIDNYNDFLFISLEMIKEGSLTFETEEISVFVTPTTLILLPASDCSQIIDLIKEFQRPHLQISPLSHPSWSLYTFLDMIVDGIFPLIDSYNDKLDSVEDTILDSISGFSPTTLLTVKRELLLLRRLVAPLRDLVNNLLRIDWISRERELLLHYQDLYDHTLRALEQIDAMRDILSGMMETMIALNGNKLNLVMKKMTAISTILMSITLIASIYGMNFETMPELKSAYGYPIALISMGLTGLLLFFCFKRIDWL